MTNLSFTRRTAFAGWATLILGILSTVQVARGESLQESVLIQLRERNDVDHALVLLQDIAEVTGGDVALRRQMAQLDLEELELPPSQTTIRKSRVEVRLLLAGFRQDQFRMFGPDSVTAARQHPMLSDQSVVDSIRQPLADLWRIAPEFLLIRLTQPLEQSVPRGIELSENTVFRPFLNPGVVPGRSRLNLGVYAGDQLVHTFAVALDIQVERPVAIAKADVAVGDPFTFDNVQFVTRRLTGRMAIDAVGHDIVGKFASRPIRNRMQIEQAAVSEKPEPVETPASQSVDVEVPGQATVTLVAQKKGLVIRLSGGKLVRRTKVGQPADVRNSSGEVISGTLVTPTEVRVQF